MLSCDVIRNSARWLWRTQEVWFGFFVPGFAVRSHVLPGHQENIANELVDSCFRLSEGKRPGNVGGVRFTDTSDQRNLRFLSNRFCCPEPHNRDSLPTTAEITRSVCTDRETNREVDKSNGTSVRIARRRLYLLSACPPIRLISSHRSNSRFCENHEHCKHTEQNVHHSMYSNFRDRLEGSAKVNEQ